MLGLRQRLLGAPGRVADAATLLLGDEPYDLAWLTFCAAHVAGHQFWDLSQLDPAELDADTERLLGATLDDVYVAVDAALGTGRRLPSPRTPTCWSSRRWAWT